MLLAALNEVIALEDWDVEGEMPSATVHRRDAEPLAFNAGNKNDVAYIDDRGGAVPDAASVEERHERHSDHSDALADAVAGWHGLPQPLGQSEQADVPSEHGLPDFEPRSRDAHDTNGDRAYCLQGNMIGRTAKNGPQGNGVNDEIAFTLNTVDRHAVSFKTRGGQEPSCSTRRR